MKAFSSKVKVCHLTSVHDSKDVRIFTKECCSLAQMGLKVFLVAPNATDEVINGVTIVNSGASRRNRLGRMTKTVFSVYKKAKRLDADIYHIHDPELLSIALLLRISGKKVIYDAHEDLPQTILEKYWINKNLRRTMAIVVKFFENFAGRQMSYIISATPYIRDRFLKVNKNTLDINNYPLSSEFASGAEWEKRKNEICYAGVISRERGILQLMQALDMMDGIRLNLAGSFDPDELKSDIQKMKSWERVNYSGYVGRKEVASILSHSKAGVVTFLPLPNHINAQPNKLFEYMSAAIPVVASDFPLWKQIIEKNNCGVCVNPHDSKQIAGAVKYLLENDAEAKMMGQNGQKAVAEKYNWEAEVNKLAQIYDSLI